MKKLLQRLTLLTGCLFATLAVAQQKLIPAQSDIGFSIKQMGVPVDGKFTKFDAQIAFDPKKPEVAKIAFTIDLGSAVVGDAETIKELKKPEWFNSIKFPSATFTSTTIKAIGHSKFEVSGNLSIKGVAKPVLIPVTLSKGGTGTIADGSFGIKRADFKIGEGDWSDFSIVANDVQVKFKLSLSGV